MTFQLKKITFEIQFRLLFKRGCKKFFFPMLFRPVSKLFNVQFCGNDKNGSHFFIIGLVGETFVLGDNLCDYTSFYV